jgi:rhodanese-related sulfurtransferase
MTQTITVAELAERVRDDGRIRLIDVRSPGEYAAGHVPGAINIPLEQVESRLDDLGQGPIAVLCQSGRRAGVACNLLDPHGHDLLLVRGGTKAWSEADLPLVASSSSRWSLERQVRLIAGLLVLTGSVLAATVSPGWIFLSAFVGAGLTFAGLTDICGMGLLLAKMPWNRAKTKRSGCPAGAKS